jgi:cytochrome c
MKTSGRILQATAHAADPARISTQAGCAVCHATDKKLVGPSWTEVAARYQGDAAAPALRDERVCQGGSGV